MWSKAQTISLVWVHLNRFDVSGGAKTVISLFGVGRSIQKERRRLFPSHIQMQGGIMAWIHEWNNRWSTSASQYGRRVVSKKNPLEWPWHGSSWIWILLKGFDLCSIHGHRSALHFHLLIIYFLHSLWGLKLKAIEALYSVQPQWCLVAESGITTETPAHHCGCIK